MDKLPAELTFDILLRLSVESLVKCRVVCKSWNALTRDPEFIASHSKASESSSTIVLFNHAVTFFDNTTLMAETPTENLPFRNQGLSEEPIHGPCNGIICLYGAALWNPATNETKVIPPSNLHHLENDFFYVYSYVGFGHDPVTNDYKVVRIMDVGLRSHDSWYANKRCINNKCRAYHSGAERDLDLTQRVELYSLNTNSWKLVQSSKKIRFPYIWFHSVCANGSCHWLGSSYYNVTSFDMTTEVFSETIIVDPTRHWEIGLIRLVELDGSLSCLIENDFGELNIWMMDSNKEWIKRSTIELVDKLGGVVSIRESGDLILRYHKDCSKKRVGYKLQVWHPSTYDMKILNVKLTGPIYGTDGPPRCFHYKETLVPLNTRGLNTNTN